MRSLIMTLIYFVVVYVAFAKLVLDCRHLIVLEYVYEPQFV